MAELKSWRKLPAGGRVSPATAPQPRTGGWRTGMLPEVDGTTFTGFDLDYCKGCEICAEVCPTGAITMVEERV